MCAHAHVFEIMPKMPTLVFMERSCSFKAYFEALYQIYDISEIQVDQKNFDRVIANRKLLRWT